MFLNKSINEFDILNEGNITFFSNIDTQKITNLKHINYNSLTLKLNNYNDSNQKKEFEYKIKVIKII